MESLRQPKEVSPCPFTGEETEAHLGGGSKFFSAKVKRLSSDKSRGKGGQPNPKEPLGFQGRFSWNVNF